MEKEFCPYDIALALKELGFESPYPIGGYQGGKVFYYEKGELYYDGRPMYSSDAHSGQLLAPLYQQVFRWFEDNHSMFVERIITTSANEILDIEYILKSWKFAPIKVELKNPYDNSIANDTCLSKLIEILK